MHPGRRQARARCGTGHRCRCLSPRFLIRLPQMAIRDHINRLTGLVVTSKIVLLVTARWVPARRRPGRSEVHVVVILLGLAAAVLYGSGDFLGGMATRRAHVLAVLTVV